MMEDNLEYIDDFEWESMLHSGEFSNGDIRQLLREREAAKERIVELESRLDLGTGNMYDVVVCENERLTQRIAELEAAQRWIPVEERLPEQGDYYQVVKHCAEGAYTTHCYYYGDGLWDIVSDQVTHWKPDSPLPDGSK